MIITIAILCMYKIAILAMAVNIIRIVFEIIYVILYAALFPKINFNTSLKNLPPSIGYIGIKLNIAIKKLEYISI